MNTLVRAAAAIVALTPGCAFAQYVSGFDAPVPAPPYETLYQGPVPLPSYVYPAPVVVAPQPVAVPVPVPVAPVAVPGPQVCGYQRTTTVVETRARPRVVYRSYHRPGVRVVERAPVRPRVTVRRTTTVVAPVVASPIPPPNVYGYYGAATPTPVGVVAAPVPYPTCRVYKYWNGERCVDARWDPPELR